MVSGIQPEFRLPGPDCRTVAAYAFLDTRDWFGRKTEEV